ncbi:MAG: cell division protein FtsA [bacterium]|nr:cell division protein FtsA [bacterium]
MIHKNRAPNDLITAIDLGSSRCLTLMATRDGQSGEMRVVGVGNVPSRGIRRATIINLEEAIKTVEQSVAMAEKICGINAESVYMNVGGQHISSLNSNGVVVVADSNNEITESDVDRAIEAARAISLPADREILNLTPRFYTVDSQEGVRDPLRMVGVRLETDIHLITCSSSALRNLEKTLNDVDLDKDGFVFSGFAASEVVLTEAEKEAGVICIDLGADTTSYCVFVDGAILLSGVIPIGARYVTQDINAYTHVGLENAEKIKISLSEEEGEIEPQRPDESREEYRRRLKQLDTLNLSDYEPNIKPSTMSKANLIRAVIMPRLKEIFGLIAQELKKNKINDKLGAGAVIVGGGAKTVGLVEVATRALNMQVRLGVPNGTQGVVRHLNDPAYATAIGLLTFALKEQASDETDSSNKKNGKEPTFDNIFGKIGRSLKKFMP